MALPNHCLTPRQVSAYRWELINSHGTILLSDVYQPHAAAAEEWVKCYVSSWPAYTYKIEPKED